MISVRTLKVLAWAFFVCFSALPPILGGASLAGAIGHETTRRVLNYVGLGFGLLFLWSGSLLLLCLTLRAVEEDESLSQHHPCEHNHATEIEADDQA